VDLVNVNGQSAGSVEAARAVRATEVFGFLVLNQNYNIEGVDVS
jgi:hypothetical protein